MKNLLIFACMLLSAATLGQEKRLALVIGNAEYDQAPTLANPENDAKAIGKKLKSLDFDVIEYVNLDQRSMKRAIDEFGSKLKGYEVGLFFYAGHGLQVEGNNYLVPSDASLSDVNDVEYNCVRADRVLGKMESSNSKTNIVILDACRDNPFERSWTRGVKGQGLAFMNAPAGSLIAYATAPGRTALDGKPGKNGPYTEALLKHIGTPNLSIVDIFTKVRVSVQETSQGRQVPWESTSLMGSFYFNFDENLPVLNEEEIPSQWVIITSDPRGGDLYINDKHVGQTPFQQEMKEGSYRYTIRKDLHHEERGEFALVAEEGRKKIEIILKPRFGTLTIKSYPEEGASVSLNGVPTGELTPYSQKQLTSGSYSITLRKEWYETKTEQFKIEDGEDKILNVNMKPRFGEVHIAGDPDSEIWVDGELKGSGYFEGRLNAGLHTVEVRKDNFHATQRKMEIIAGKKKEVTMKLKPKQGTLKIMATPVETKIRLNGENYGTTPRTIRELPAGNYRLELRMEGYKTLSREIEITDNKTLEINEELQSSKPAMAFPSPGEEEKIKEENRKEKSRSDKTGDIKTGRILLKSVVLPGWGLTELSDGKPYWLTGVAAYACVATSIVCHQRAQSSYNSYLEPTDLNALGADYDRAITQQTISRATGIAAAVIWAGTLSYTTVKVLKLKKDPMSLNNGATLYLGLRPASLHGGAIASLNLVF